MPSVYRSRASAVCDSVTLTVPSKSVPPGGRQKAYSAPAAAGSAPALLTPQLPAKAARWSKAPQATVVPIISCAADKFSPPEGPFRRRLPGLSSRHPERLPHKSGIHPPGANIQTRCLSGCGWRYSCADRSDKPDRPVLFYPAVPDAPAAGPPAD